MNSCKNKMDKIRGNLWLAVQGGLSVFVVGLSMLFAADCPNYGPVEAGCDTTQTEHGCPRTRNEIRCNGGTKVVLLTNPFFGCGTSVGKKNCRNGILKDGCYREWGCSYGVAGPCKPDPDDGDLHTAFMKVADDCDP